MLCGEELLPVISFQHLAKLANQRLNGAGGLMQLRGRTLGCGGRIVQFMRQTSCHRAQRNQFLALVGIAFEIPQPVGGRPKKLPSDRMAGADHSPEILLVQPKQSRGLRHTNHSMPRCIQQQRNLAHVHARLVDSQQDLLVVVAPGDANFSFQVEEEELRRRVRFNENRAG